MIIVRCTQVPQWGQKRKSAYFRLKSHSLEKSLLQSFFV